MVVPDSVKVVLGPGDVAMVHEQVIVHGQGARDRLTSWASGDDLSITAHEGDWWRFSGVSDPINAIEALRAEGHVAQPNHVWRAHACPTPCRPHPALAHPVLEAIANPLMGNPLMGNPLMGNPLMGNPLMGNPLMGNPLMGNPLMGNRAPENTAAPARGRTLPKRDLPGMDERPVVAILDTGLAKDRPDLLGSGGAANQVSGGEDEPDVDLRDRDGNLLPKDDWLDPVAGHGTFIAGLVEQLAPGCRIHVPRVLSPFGDATEAEVADAVRRLTKGEDDQLGKAPDVIGMSFGGTALDAPGLLRSAIAEARAKDIVVVASAGNDGTCEPAYPAAFDGVIAVGALGPAGPAPWSNYGDWVDACAPGTNLVSSFFRDFNGGYPMKNTVDVDAFEQWAIWSGTSFAVPVVIAAIVREMVVGDCKATDAVTRVVHAEHLLRIPCMGTVVNI